MKSGGLKFVSVLMLAAFFFIAPTQTNAQCSFSNTYSFDYDKHSYQVVKENLTWTDAARCATQRGGYLVEVNSKGEQDTLFSELINNANITFSKTLSQFSWGTVWLGGNDSAVEGKWIWDGDNDGKGPQFWSGGITGSPVGGRYNKWGNEPDNSGNQDALSMTLQNTGRNLASEWNDLDGNNNRIYYIIEFDCLRSFDTIDVFECKQYISPSGKTYTRSRKFTDTITNKQGCDSIISINLTIGDARSRIDPVACESFVSPSGKIWTKSGFYQDTILTKRGCDSMITIGLTIRKSSKETMDTATCYSYTSPSGKLWTQSGIYFDTIPNIRNCDSFITINLTIFESSTSTLNPEECTSYTSPGGKKFSMTGTYKDTIANARGCDSLITINLLIKQSSSSINPIVCKDYVSPSGKTLTASGLYLDTIPNAAGCDSLITINLEVNNSILQEIDREVCKEYTSPSGKIWTETGSYLDTIPNHLACDSFLRINLVINKVDTNTSRSGNSIVASADNATYQWLDCDNNHQKIDGEISKEFIASKDGNYAVEVTQDNCVDTSSCTNIQFVGIPTTHFTHKFEYYPNPSSGRLNLRFASNPNFIEVRVYSIHGDLLSSQNFSETKIISLDLPEKEGVYYIHVDSKDGFIQRFKTIRLKQ